ncbi:MAG TPA: SGNH/GDSL hydrolase family protein [Nitrospirota bacterium]|nr:SGNH/GDSL hydrolase family protein [Nitrospirota bacterium]
MNRKKLLFTIILLLPALLLVVLTVNTILDIIAINRVDPQIVYQDLKDALPRRHPWSFDMPDSILGQNPSEKTVFVFGESSLILSDGGTFPEYLEKDHKGLRVVNFGVSAIDSLTVRQRVTEALSLSRPDVIILYYGHNDYNVAYHAYLLPKYFERFDLLLRLAYIFHVERNPVARFADYDFYTFARLYRPRLIRLFQKLGLIRIDQKAYEPVNQLILDQYIRNNEAILSMTSSMHIPVVVITPVGNLHVEPHGDLNTTSLHTRGINTADYAQSIALLKKARDAELLTYDLRAKSPLAQYIRDIRKPNVYVLDLETLLETRRFGFGNEDFVDYFHFNDRSHRLVADIIYDFMVRKKLVAREVR